MTPSEACFNLVKRFEGCRLTAYPDPATGGDPWTIGFGTTGPGIKPGTVITQDDAENYLRRDLVHVGEQIDKLLTVDVTQGQFDALVSLAYNIGVGNLAKSTLLRKLNAGDVLGAAMEFPKWRNAAGRVMPGLVTRRAAEQALFQLGG